MKKKVLFVATVLRGHLLVFHLPYLQWFQQQGYEVHCCAGNDTDKESVYVPYCDRFIEMDFVRDPLKTQGISLMQKMRKSYRQYEQLKTLMNTEEYALIHCHTPIGGVMGRLAARRARKHGTRVCYTAHGFHFFSGAPLKNWILFYTVERFLARFTDLLITINHEDYQRAKRFRAGEVVLVPGVGVNLSQFSLQVDESEVREELGIPTDMPIIITVGEHSKRKNHAVCIQALTLVKNAVLVFCGVGQEEEALKELAKEHKVSERIRFLGFRRDIPRLLKASDIFIFSSLHEGLPKSLMEAMAAGLPCIVSDVRGNTDLIQNDCGGYVCKPHDVQGFAEKLTMLMQNPALQTKFGKRNRKEVEKYALPNVLQEMQTLYNSQLGKRGDN